MRTHLAPVAALLAAVTAAPLSAQDLSRYLPEDTSVVAHFDIQECLAIVGRRMIEDELGFRSDAKMGQVLDLAEDRWGFSPLEDILGVTVFSSSLEGGQPSFMIWVSDRIDSMVEDLRESGALERERVDGVRLMRLSAWGLARALDVDDDDVQGNGEAWTYIHRAGDRRAILVGENPEDILATARVLEGDDDSVADARRPRVSADIDQGTIAYLEVGGNLGDWGRGSGPASAVISKVEGMQMAIARDDENLQARAVIDVGSRQEARSVASILDGLRGLIRLAEDDLGDVPEMAVDLLRSIDCDTEDSKVVLEASLPFDVIRREVRKQTRRSR